jgi:hypothetical protein
MPQKTKRPDLTKMEAFPTMENAEITVRTVHLVPAPDPSDLRSQLIRFAFFFSFFE